MVGLICVVIYTAVVAYIGFGPVFGVPNPALLAVVVGVLELIPVVAPATSMPLIRIIGAAAGRFAAIFLMAYAVALRLSIDNLVGPLALGRAATVHPVVGDLRVRHRCDAVRRHRAVRWPCRPQPASS